MKIHTLKSIYSQLDNTNRIQFWVLASSCFVAVFTFFVGLVYQALVVEENKENNELSANIQLFTSLQPLIARQTQFKEATDNFKAVIQLQDKFGIDTLSFMKGVQTFTEDAKIYSKEIQNSIRMFPPKSHEKITAYADTISLLVGLIELGENLPPKYSHEEFIRAFYGKAWPISYQNYESMSDSVYTTFSKSDNIVNTLNLCGLLVDNSIGVYKEVEKVLPQAYYSKTSSTYRIICISIGLFIFGIALWILMANIVFPYRNK